MRINGFATHAVTFLVGLTVVAPANAQRLPREDVVEIPAVGDGLWVSNVFQSGMVLQRDKPISVWGWADPGEKVTVRFVGEGATTTAGDDRAWMVSLPAVPAHEEPQVLTIEGGKQKLTLNNILVGDVWLLGGQSNMEFELAKVENGGNRQL